MTSFPPLPPTCPSKRKPLPTRSAATLLKAAFPARSRWTAKFPVSSSRTTGPATGRSRKARAEQLAKLGYIALALDMYGKGIHANNPDEAGKLAGAFYKTPGLFATRAQAALAELLKQPGVDPERIGGHRLLFRRGDGARTRPLRRERAGRRHLPRQPENPGARRGRDIKAKEILVLHGSRDPLVPPADVAGFMDEMNAAKVPFRLVAYPDAVHAFTNPEAGSDPSKPTAYNARRGRGGLRRDDGVFCGALRVARRAVTRAGSDLEPRSE